MDRKFNGRREQFAESTGIMATQPRKQTRLVRFDFQGETTKGAIVSRR